MRGAHSGLEQAAVVGAQAGGQRRVGAQRVPPALVGEPARDDEGSRGDPEPAPEGAVDGPP